MEDIVRDTEYEVFRDYTNIRPMGTDEKFKLEYWVSCYLCIYMA